MKITINPNYQAMVPKMPEQDYSNLKADIKKNGLNYPVIVNGDGVLLDGHHRFNACQELGLECKYTTKYFNDPLDEQEFVITSNLVRRHLTIGQRVLLGIQLEVIEMARAKAREFAGKTLGSIEPRGKAAEIAAEKAQLKYSTYFRGKAVLERGSELLKKQFIAGDIKADKGYNTIQHEERRAKAKEDAINGDWVSSSNYELHQGDILEMGQYIPDGSVDLVFTDPPYLGETLDVYAKLGQLAMRVLKPGGSLVTIVGHHYIFDIHEMITSHDGVLTRDHYDLRYHWMIVLRHGGHARRVHAYGVWAHYKPLLWYYKPIEGSQKPTMYHDMSDLVESKPVDKDLHEWEQSTIEAKNVIHSLTVEGQKVLDPFLGSGTTGIAALEMGRKFIGIELDPITMKIAAKRLHQVDTAKIMGVEK